MDEPTLSLNPLFQDVPAYAKSSVSTWRYPKIDLQCLTKADLVVVSFAASSLTRFACADCSRTAALTTPPWTSAVIAAATNRPSARIISGCAPEVPRVATVMAVITKDAE
jgi:hypothetical protein